MTSLWLMRPLGEQDPRSAGPYRLLAELGQDETGRVMVGCGNGDLFVIKLVHAHVVEVDGFRDRLGHELSSDRRFNRNVPVVGGDADSPVPWVALEYVPGASLEAALTETRSFGENDLLRLATALASALKKVHGNRLVHGELSPATVRLTGADPLLIDFGVARAVGRRTSADDVRALGVLLDSVGERPLPASVRRIVTACMAPADERPTAGALLKVTKKPFDLPGPQVVHELAHEEVDELADVLAQTRGVPGMDGRLRRTRADIDRWPGAPRHRIPRWNRVREDFPVVTPVVTGRGVHTVLNESRRPVTFREGALIAATAAFVGWLAGQLVFGGADVTELPDHATLVETTGLYSLPLMTWTTVGYTMGVICVVLLLFIGNPRTTKPVWIILITLSLAPFVLWAFNTLAGLDIDVVTASTGGIAAFGELLAIFLCFWTWIGARKLFRNPDFWPVVIGFLSGSVAFGAFGGCLAFGWMGIVIAGVIRVDVVTLLAAAVAGSLAYRRLQRAA